MVNIQKWLIEPSGTIHLCEKSYHDMIKGKTVLKLDEILTSDSETIN